MKRIKLKLMTSFKIFLFTLFIGLYSCAQNKVKPKPNPLAVEQANKIIPLSPYYENPDSCRKALTFLDSATVIDSNCFLCYSNKLMFLNSLKEYGKAISTINNLIRLKPNAHDLYLTGGMFCERNNDTISSKTYFQKSLSICNVVLDTMILSNSDYDMIMTNKSINLIMLDKKGEANTLLKNLYDSQKDRELKEMTLSMMNKNKSELIKLLYH
jgi:tetratricopeptide (TPR) repeat protein